MNKNITILFGSETGNAEYCSYTLEKKLNNLGFKATAYEMDSYDINKLSEDNFLIIITATHGEGEPPDNAQSFFEYLNNNKPNLAGKKFAVCGLGDTMYENFAQAGKDFDKLLENLGAQRIIDRVDCDVMFEDKFEEFKNQIIDYIQNKN